MFCEFCGSYGDCSVCKSMLPDLPTRSIALASLPSRRTVYADVWTRRSWFAAVALIVSGLTGLVALAVAAIVGPLVGW